MSLNPIPTYQMPAYARREHFLENPSLFDESIPRRWKRAKIAAGSIAAAVLSGCSSNISDPDIPPSTDPQSHITTNPIGPAISQQVVTESTDSFYVAPLFLHGDGRGSTGCVMIAPPVFLSEAEACSVIIETLEKYGVALDTNKVVLPNVMLAAKGARIDSLTLKCTVDSFEEVPLELNGYDTSKKIGVKFVSMKDHWKMRKNDGCECSPTGEMHCSSVSSYDLPDVAADVADGMRRQGTIHGGVFYDPCVNYDYMAYNRGTVLERTELLNKAHQQANELLRQQVIDFANYLKNKEVIIPLSVKNRR